MEQLEIIRAHIAKLYDLKKSTGIWVLQDIIEVLNGLDEVGYAVDDLEYKLSPEYPDQQAALNFELTKHIEGGPNAA